MTEEPTKYPFKPSFGYQDPFKNTDTQRLVNTTVIEVPGLNGTVQTESHLSFTRAGDLFMEMLDDLGNAIPLTIQQGPLHSLVGPAIVCRDKSGRLVEERYYINGRRLSREAWEKVAPVCHYNPSTGVESPPYDELKRLINEAEAEVNSDLTQDSSGIESL